MGRIVWVIFFVLAVQGIFTFFQIKDFQKNAAELRKKGRIGIGNEKRRMSAGAIILFAADANRIIVEGRSMEGISVFSKFKPFTEYNGSKLTTVLNDVERKLETASSKDSAKLNAIRKATRMLLDTYEESAGEEMRDLFVDLVEDSEIVDVEATTEISGERTDPYERFKDLSKVEEPKIIDVEEIRSTER
ncbi:MAG: transcriptional regulator GutM [Peptostreptococcaceae bacterium]|nr:transcriptional regulator GutM [Peptostreptococcaceae bacterium]